MLLLVRHIRQSKELYNKFRNKKNNWTKEGDEGGVGEGGVGKAFSISHETINNLSEKHDQLK